MGEPGRGQPPEMASPVDPESDVTPQPAGRIARHGPATNPRRALEALFEAAGDAIVRTDREQRVVRWNHAAEGLYGIPAGEAQGRPIDELLDSTVLARGISRGDLLRETVDLGSWVGRVRDRPRVGGQPGAEIVVETALSLVRGPDGAPDGVVDVSRDVTLIARLEERLDGLTTLGSYPLDAELHPKIAEAALDILCETLVADYGLIVTIDDHRYRLEAARNVPRPLLDSILALDLTGSPLLARLAQPGGILNGPLETAPMFEPTRQMLLGAGLRWVGIAGLRGARGPFGFVGLGWPVPPVTRPSDTLLVQIASRVAVALDNARLLEEVASGLSKERRLAARLEALVGLTRLPVDAGDEPAQAGTLLDQLRTALGARSGLVIRLDGETSRHVAADTGVDPGLRAAIEALPVAESATVRRLRAGGSAFVELFSDSSVRPDVIEAATRAGYLAWAAIPIRDDGRLTSYVLLYFDGPADRISVDSRTLDAISSIVSIAVANQRLRRETAVALDGQRRFVDHLAALQSLTGIGEAATGFQELAESIVALVVASLGAVGGCYGNITTDGRFAIQASANMAPEMTALAEGPSAVTDLAAVRRLAAGEGPFIQPFADESSEALARVASAAGYTAFAVLPIRLNDRLEAVIVAYFDRPLGELALEQRMLDAVTRISGISIANFRLREGLVVSEERYRTLFEESPEAYLVLDDAGTVVAANAAASRLYRPDGAISGRHLDDLHEMFTDPSGAVARRSQDRAAEIGHLIEPGGRGTMRGTGLRADGSRFPDEVFLSRVAIGDDPRILVRVHDLTEQERLQQELVQAQKMEAIGMLVSGVAHELNNPLAAIIGYSTLLRRDERLPEEMRRDAEILLQEADRTRRIVQNLLEFARQRSPERHPTAVRALIASTLQLQSYSIGAGRIDVNVDIPASLPAVDVDRAQLQQVLLNLTQNAIQAIRDSDRPGSIDVRAESGSGRDGRGVVRLRITDSGPGVPPHLRSQLFLPFFTTKAPGEGTGLGLSVSFGIVAAHGGRLWFEPGPNDRGASFVLELPVEERPTAAAPAPTPIAVAPPRDTMTIPRADIDAAQSAAGSLAASPEVSVEGIGEATGADDAGAEASDADASGTDTPDPRPRVLVLDDEPSILAFLGKALSIAGYRAIITSSGPQAVAAVRQARVDAVLCDHRMSGMSGTEAYDAVTAIQPDLRHRFVFMSGDVLNPQLVEFATQRGIRLLPKPFDLDTVGRTLREVLGAAQGSGSR